MKTNKFIIQLIALLILSSTSYSDNIETDPKKIQVLQTIVNESGQQYIDLSTYSAVGQNFR